MKTKVKNYWNFYFDSLKYYKQKKTASLNMREKPFSKKP